MCIKLFCLVLVVTTFVDAKSIDGESDDAYQIDLSLSGTLTKTRIKRDDKRYYMNSYLVNWADALKQCKRQDPNSELATIKNDEDKEDIQGFMYGQGDLATEYWIGGTHTSKGWKWVDGNSGLPTTTQVDIGVISFNNTNSNPSQVSRLTITLIDGEAKLGFSDNTSILKYICDKKPSCGSC